MKSKGPKADYRVVNGMQALVAQISAHWALADAVLPPEYPLVVLAGVDAAAFSALPAQAVALRTLLRERLMEHRLVSGALRQAKAALRERLAFLRSHVRGFRAGTPWERLLPILPDALAGAQVFLEPMRRAALLWGGVAALPPAAPGMLPVTPDGCDAAQFATELAAVESLWDALRECALEVRLTRSALEVFHRHAASAVAAYGHSARGRLPPGHALLDSLPRLWGKGRAAAGDA